MAEPDEALRALGVEDDEELAALGVQDDSEPPTPDETSVASSPYGPEPRPDVREDLKPSAWGNIQDAADVMGLPFPSKEAARGAVAAFLQGPGRNWGDEAAGRQAELQQILKNWRLPPDQRIDPRWARRNARDTFRGVEKAFREEHPVAGFGLTVGSNMLTSPFKAGNIATVGEGMLAGAGASEEIDANTPRDALLGGAFSLAGKQGGELIGEGLGWGARAAGRTLSGLVQPSAAARYLQSMGVDDLTIGQMSPSSMAAQFEEVGTSVGGVGPSIASQREAGRRAWQNAVMGEATAPGAAPPDAAAPIASQLDEAYKGFQPAYAQARGYSVPPERVQSALAAIDDTTIHASDGERAQAAKFVRDQMTALRLGEDGMVSSDATMALRSFLRDKIRSLKGDLNQPFRELYQNVVDHLSVTLDDTLPPEAAAALRAADRAYAGHKVVERAVYSAGDQRTGFSPTQLSEAVKAAATERGPYARGTAGGELRSLAEAGKEALDARIPTTGARLMASGPMQWVTGPASYMANLPGPKRFLTGGNDWQQADWLTTLAQTDPEALGKWGQYLGAAASQSPEALGAAHRELSETDPEYQQAMRRNGGQSP